MLRKCCTAQNVALRAIAGAGFLLSVASCGTVELFGQYDLPESAEVETAPYPRLVDVPSAPARGTYTAAVPDPLDGARAQADLSSSAVQSEQRANKLSGPVIPPAERERLLAAAKRKR
ncbi:MAG: hypothetical protein AB8B85_15320 [Paracoccaceae bacterium]